MIVGGFTTITLIFVAMPLLRWLAAVVGQLAAKPVVDAHDQSGSAHIKQFSEIREAIRLADQAIVNLQRQIDTSERNQHDRLDAVQAQLKMAVDLLERG